MIHSGQTDEVWLLPCGPRPDKPSLKTSTLDRVIMCHLAVATTFGSRFPISVCSDELAEEKALSSYIMMNRMEAKHPSIDFAFVVGSDLLGSMRNWSADGIPDAGERLWNEKKFLVIPRPDASGDGGVAVADLPDNFNVIGPAFEGGHLVTTRLSSSEVRRRINGAGRAARHEQGQLISADEYVSLPLRPPAHQARARSELLAEHSALLRVSARALPLLIIIAFPFSRLSTLCATTYTQACAEADAPLARQKLVQRRGGPCSLCRARAHRAL